MVLMIALAVLAAIYLFLVAPRMFGKPDRSALMGVHYAHRGLFDNDSDAPENSLNAMRKAVEAGYGIEFDIQLTKDADIFSRHLCAQLGALSVAWTIKNRKHYEEAKPHFDLVIFDSFIL